MGKRYTKQEISQIQALTTEGRARRNDKKRRTNPSGVGNSFQCGNDTIKYGVFSDFDGGISSTIFISKEKFSRVVLRYR